MTGCLTLLIDEKLGEEILRTADPRTIIRRMAVSGSQRRVFSLPTGRNCKKTASGSKRQCAPSCKASVLRARATSFRVHYADFVDT